jgi:nitric oxide reductase subunit B
VGRLFLCRVAFWNLVGAGIFGFMINPPIALYYMQGLNTTAVHAHGALYGVYGTLGLGLLLFCLRAMKPELNGRNDRFGCLLGYQYRFDVGNRLEPAAGWFAANVSIGFCRLLVGAEFRVHADRLMQTLRWLRMIGDTIFRPRRDFVRLLCARFDVAASDKKAVTIPAVAEAV